MGNWSSIAKRVISSDHKLLLWVLHALSCLASILVIGYSLGTRMPFGSVDVALHYLLVTDYVDWSRVSNETMRSYPPGAHILAASVARLSRLSPFMAMYETSLASIFVIYFVLYRALQEFELWIALIGSASTVLIVFLLRQSWSIYGFEIVGNFFFAQAAGAAVFLAVLWIATGQERNFRDVWVYPICAFVLGWIYPLAAIDWAAACGVLWIFHLCTLWFLRKLEKRHLLMCLWLCVALGASIVLNPEFRFMFGVSYNDGGFNPIIGSLRVLFAYSMTLALVGMILLFFSFYNHSRSILFFGAASVATAVAGMGQATAFYFGLGSEYAVRKHTFGIITILVFASVALISEVTRRIVRFQGRQSAPLRVLVASACAVVCILGIMNVYAYERAPFLAMQNEVRNLPMLRGRTVSLHSDLQSEFNYILSLSDFRIPIELAVQQNLGIETHYAGRRPDFALVSRSAPSPKQCDIPEVQLRFSRLIRFNCAPPIP